MGTLEKVIALKKEGKNEPEIIATLRSQGTTPMEISDAINQSKIKEAIVDPNPTEGMTPSIMQDEENIGNKKMPEEKVPQENLYSPEQTTTPQPPQSMAPQEQYYAPQKQYYNQSAGQPQQPQQQYQEQPFSGYNQEPDEYSQQNDASGYSEYDEQDNMSGSTDTIIEVAEQVFSEKIKKIAKELKNFSEFKMIYETKVDNLSHRLERMEKNFDKMQLDILGKVSEYGKGLNYMKKELNMVQDSFGKMNQKR